MSKVFKKLKNGFTQIPNSIFEAKLSAKAIGIYAFIMSRADGWDFSIDGTAAVLEEGRYGIRTGIRELEDARYLKRQQNRNGHQFASSDWMISDEPFPPDEVETVDGFQPTSNQTASNQTAGNQPEYNNIGNNTVLKNTIEKNNTDVSGEIPFEKPLESIVPEKNKKEKKPKSVFVPPTLQQVKDFFREKCFTEESAIKAFEHYNNADWHDRNNNPVLNWKQKMGTNWFTEANKIKTQTIPLRPKMIMRDDYPTEEAFNEAVRQKNRQLQTA